MKRRISLGNVIFCLVTYALVAVIFVSIAYEAGHSPTLPLLVLSVVAILGARPAKPGGPWIWQKDEEDDHE